MTAKFNLLVVTAIPAIAIVPLLACGGGSDKTVDAATNGSGSGSGSSNGSGSGSGSGSASVCLLPSNLGTLSSFPLQAVLYRNGSATSTLRANRLTFVGALDGSATERIQLSIYGGCGSTGSNCSGQYPVTPDWPAAFTPKSGLDLAHPADFSMAALAGVGSNTIGAIYLATSGTLNVGSAVNGSGSAGSGAVFAGDLSNVVLVHVDVGSAGATPDPDGCTATITSMTFSGTSFTGKSLEVDDVVDLGVTFLRHRFTQQ